MTAIIPRGFTRRSANPPAASHVRGGMTQPLDSIDAEDGSDPRRYHDRRGRHRPPAAPGSTGRPPGRKAVQLAGQIHQLISGLLAACGDDALRALEVVSVTPAPDSPRMHIVVRGEGSAGEIAAKLDAAAGWLRVGVAAGVTRRRVPGLAFGVG